MDVRESLLTMKLIDALYTEAMLLADEARSYFESGRFHEESDPDHRALGSSPVTDHSMADRFPEEARQIVLASEELFQRLQRLSMNMEREMEAESAVQDMFRRLKSSF